MKSMLLIFAYLAIISFSFSAGPTPIENLRLQGNLDADGHDILNVGNIGSSGNSLGLYASDAEVIRIYDDGAVRFGNELNVLDGFGYVYAAGVFSSVTGTFPNIDGFIDFPAQRLSFRGSSLIGVPSNGFSIVYPGPYGTNTGIPGLTLYPGATNSPPKISAYDGAVTLSLRNDDEIRGLDVNARDISVGPADNRLLIYSDSGGGKGIYAYGGDLIIEFLNSDFSGMDIIEGDFRAQNNLTVGSTAMFNDAEFTGRVTAARSEHYRPAAPNLNTWYTNELGKRIAITFTARVWTTGGGDDSASVEFVTVNEGVTNSVVASTPEVVSSQDLFLCGFVDAGGTYCVQRISGAGGSITRWNVTTF